MKRCIWIGLLVVALAMSSAGCGSIKAMWTKRAEEKKAKVEKTEKVKAEKVKAEKKKEAKAEKAEKAQAETPAGLTKVESSVLDAVGYDANAKELTVVLKSGDTYVYRNVPEKVYNNLMAAESKGKFFTKNIKDKYEYTKK